MLRSLSCLLVMSMICLLGCHSSPDSSTEVVPPTTDFPLGSITDSVAVPGANQEWITIYAPKLASGKSHVGTILLLDPHARGYQSVARYRELADRFGFILVGSRFSRNGLPPEQAVAHANRVREFLKSTFYLTDRQVFVSGFSGGARLAVLLTMMQRPFAGSIPCGGFFPQGQDPGKLKALPPALAFCGTADFNLLEMRNAKQILQQNPASTLVEFDGRHDWPDTEAFEPAFTWLTLRTIQYGTNPDSSLVQKHNEQVSAQYQQLVEANDGVALWNLCPLWTAELHGLRNTDAFRKAVQALPQSPDVNALLKAQNQWQSRFSQEQQKLSRLLRASDQDWNTGIQLLNERIENAKIQEDRAGWTRVKAYLGFMCFMQAEGALRNRNLPAATAMIARFSQLEPENPDQFILQAKYAMYLDQPDQDRALSALQEGLAAGYDQKLRLLEIQELQPLHVDPRFQEIVQSMH